MIDIAALALGYVMLVLQEWKAALLRSSKQTFRLVGEVIDIAALGLGCVMLVLQE
jgi:hypothetical protein